MKRIRAAAAVLLLTTPGLARASGLTAGSEDRVSLDVPKDAVLLGLGLVGAGAPLVFSSQLEPSTCRWCGGPVGSPVNAVDDWFHARLTATPFSRATSDTLSSVTAYGLAPAVAVVSTVFATGPHATSGAGLRNAVIVGESVAVAEAITQVVKLSAARQRPYLHYAHVSTQGSPPDYPAAGSDANLSFPSGHTSLAASVGTSAAMVATLEDSPAAPWLWGAAGLFTVAAGSLRMMAEAHYFTDVLGGALIGAGSGVLIPLLHRRGSALSGDSAVPMVAAGGSGAVFSVAGAF